MYGTFKSIKQNDIYIDNAQKCFLSTKSANKMIHHATLKIQLCHHRNKLH